MSRDPDADSTAPPTSPRRRVGCLGKLFIAAGVLVLGVVAAWLIWLLVATGQRNAALDRLREAGVATTAAELVAQVAPVPDEVNPAPDYAAAYALIDTDAAAWREWDEFRIPPEERTSEEQAEYESLRRAVVAANAAALARLAGADAKVRPAVDSTAADFGVWSQKNGPLAANLIETGLPHLNELHESAKLLKADAGVAAESGDGERVLRNAVRMIGMADAGDDDAHTLVEHLIATGARRLAAEAVMEAGPAVATAPAALARTLTALLLDDAPAAAGHRSGTAGEATIQQSLMFEVDAGRLTVALEPPVEHKTGVRIVNLLSRPLIRMNQAKAANYTGPAVPVAGAFRLPQAVAAMPDDAWLDSPSYVYFMAYIMMPSLDRVVVAHYKARTDLRLAAATLAVHRYAADHDGELPPTLDALVPNYLPRVPIDPLAAEGDLPYDAGRGLLWSVGEDGIDDGGDASPRPGLRGAQRLGRHAGLDLVVPLRGDGGGGV